MKQQQQEAANSRRRQQQQQKKKQHHERRTHSRGSSRSGGGGGRVQRTTNKSTVPAPVSVELYNLFPFGSLKSFQQATSSSSSSSSQEDASTSTSSSSSSSLFSKKASFYFHRPQHNASLLHPIRLEIVIQDDVVTMEENNNKGTNSSSSKKETKRRERVLVSRTDDTLTVRPAWHHLNSGDETNNENELYEATLDYRKYESISFRFSMVKDSEKSEKNAQQEEQDQRETTFPCFLQIPAHPSKLLRIWKVDGNNSIVSGMQLLPPNFDLPINFPLVHYSDGSIRILPEHYQVLLENNPDEDFLNRHSPSLTDYAANGGTSSLNNSFDQLQLTLLDTPPPPPSTKKKATTTTVTTVTKSTALDDFNRFEDDVFRTLDTVASTSAVASAVSSSSSSSRCASPSALSSSASSSSNPDDGDEDDDDDDGILANLESMTQISPSLEEFQQQQADILKRENERLEQLLQQERRALQDELEATKDVTRSDDADHASDVDRVKSSLQSILQQLQEQTSEVDEATHAEVKECQRLEFLVLAQQVRLLRELRSIYPIARRRRPASTSSNVTDKDNVYTIRGLAIPHPGMDLFAGTSMTTSYYAATLSSASEAPITEDDLSAALGYLCHVVSMLSKYLSIPLRYRLICNSSRSAVQDEDCQSEYYNTTTNAAGAAGAMPMSSLPAGGSSSGKLSVLFPLFQARNIEREQVEHGVMLLERNVECLLKARGIRFDPDSHVLAKVNRIFECIVDGKPLKG